MGIYIKTISRGHIWQIFQKFDRNIQLLKDRFCSFTTIALYFHMLNLLCSHKGSRGKFFPASSSFCWLLVLLGLWINPLLPSSCHLLPILIDFTRLLLCLLFSSKDICYWDLSSTLIQDDLASGSLIVSAKTLSFKVTFTTGSRGQDMDT